jgi:SAM-dependent methyltransferase
MLLSVNLMEQLNLRNVLPTKTEQLSVCPNCGGKNLTVWCQGHDRLHRVNDQQFTYSLCRDCKLIFLSLRPVESEIKTFYPGNYEPYKATISSDNSEYPTQARKQIEFFGKRNVLKLTRRLISLLNRTIDSIHPERLSHEIERFYTPTEAGLRLLDFGCGSDFFLNRARKLGWTTVGLDFSDDVVQKICKSGHQGLLMSSDVWNKIEDESLDFVRMSHVLEHLYEPREVLENIKRKMKTGAVLHIILPNPVGVSAKIFRSRWLDLDCPRHISLYPPSELEKMLTEVDFQLIKTVPEVLTNVFSRSFGFVIHDLGLISHDAVLQLKDDQAVNSVLHSPITLSSKLGLYDRFHTFVRK